MLTGLYSDTGSAVHRVRPAVKILLLFLLCTLLFVWESWWLLGSAFAATALLFAWARIPRDHIVQSIRPALWVLAVIFAVQLILADVQLAAFVVLRFVTMILAASLVTLTTRSSEMVDGIESALRFWPNRSVAEKISLTLSLCLRFIPQVRTTFAEVRDAQRARGLANDWRALVTPTIVRTLKSADEIAQAIEARSPGGPFSAPGRRDTAVPADAGATAVAETRRERTR